MSNFLDYLNANCKNISSKEFTLDSSKFVVLLSKDSDQYTNQNQNKQKFFSHFFTFPS